jgi:hypothetical protein
VELRRLSACFLIALTSRIAVARLTTATCPLE